jgi:hypothetical protein
MTGARMVVQALKDQGVEVVFGYPGGAVLPIYDEIFSKMTSAMCWCATNRVPSTWPKAMPGPRASRALSL